MLSTYMYFEGLPHILMQKEFLHRIFCCTKFTILASIWYFIINALVFLYFIIIRTQCLTLWNLNFWCKIIIWCFFSYNIYNIFYVKKINYILIGVCEIKYLLGFRVFRVHYWYLVFYLRQRLVKYTNYGFFDIDSEFLQESLKF